MKKLAIAMLVLLGSATARAYDVPVEVGAFAGGHIFSSTSHLGLVPGSPHQLDNSGSFGMRFALDFLPRLALESELALTPTQVSGTGDSVLAFGWRGHAVVHILTGRLRPFVLVGGGGITASSSNSMVLKEDTRGELHAGVGLKFDVRCHWGLRVDARVQFEQASGSGLYFTEDWDIFGGVYGRFGRTIREMCADRK
jgi:hypothetical protein